ncbi:MAG: hypothetical protein ACK4UJ_01600 [Leptonema sp. (in: bacteria)]
MLSIQGMQNAYEIFKETGNKNEVIKHIYFLNSKELVKIYSDLDVRLNFIVHFIEFQLDKVLETYRGLERRKTYLPFTFSQYLRGALKNSFYNYLKTHKIYSQENSDYVVKENSVYLGENPLEVPKEIDMNFWFNFFYKLNQFPIIERIIFKLYYTFDLNTSELEYLIQHYGYLETKKILNTIKKSNYSHSKTKESLHKFLRNFHSQDAFTLSSKEFQNAKIDWDPRKFKKKKVMSIKKIQQFLKISTNKVYKILKNTQREISLFMIQEKETQTYSKCA